MGIGPKRWHVACTLLEIQNSFVIQTTYCIVSNTG